jgi:hypothetical protein
MINAAQISWTFEKLNDASEFVSISRRMKRACRSISTDLDLRIYHYGGIPPQFLSECKLIGSIHCISRFLFRDLPFPVLHPLTLQPPAG